MGFGKWLRHLFGFDSIPKKADELAHVVSQKADEIIKVASTKADEFTHVVSEKADEFIKVTSTKADELINMGSKKADKFIEKFEDQGYEFKKLVITNSAINGINCLSNVANAGIN